ncbi:hypothetical protein Pfo_010912 [Paulownia fortunei]|nr:hypothetical protein Pfo_010912 [Paulownia fortunei]
MTGNGNLINKTSRSITYSTHELVCASQFLGQLTWSEPVIQRTIRAAKGHRHHCLEVLQIVGFSGAAIDVELAQYVLENAVSLKKMVIDLHRPLAGQEAYAMGVTQMAMAREGVRLLKAKLPAGVELIML